MHKKIAVLFIPLFLIVLIINWSCSKIDTTDLGTDLIPAVDNVTTFDTTLLINATQGIANDSTRLAVNDNHLLGSINNDPLFGTSKADLYVQFKPTYFPYYFGSAGDTTSGFSSGLDSIVLCLSYRGMYGDTTIPQHFSVYSIDPNTSNFVDSSYKLNFKPNVTPTNLIGQVTVNPQSLREYTYLGVGKDSVNNQIRIKLSNSFAQALYNSDSSKAGISNAFYSDSAFKLFQKGFAIIADNGMGGNGLFYVNLSDVSTRLEIHFRKQNRGVIDTTYTSFPFVYIPSSTITRGAHATNLQRDRSASEFQNAPAANTLYIQTTPGTYATLSIPGLTGFPNSIIHRAEVIVEQVPSSNPLLDDILSPPGYLYLDIIDPSTGTGYKTIYYDLNPFDSYNPDNSTTNSFLPANGVDFTYYGGVIKFKKDYLGNTISHYNFNVSRYVQNLITKGSTNYQLRLSAPFQYDYYSKLFSFNNSLAFGRIRVGDGNNPNYKMRMRIIYSKIN